ncbi:MAG: hypothetical protein L4877_07965 [Aigarchaeota archaeon]|nr:hypothetical protein [Candidatus Geocrenenecus dongiae]
MKLVVRDRISGKRYELEVFEENTAKDVIDSLIEAGLIRPTPGEGYEWILLDSRFVQIHPNEKIVSRLSYGSEEAEVYLVARVTGGWMHP